MVVDPPGFVLGGAEVPERGVQPPPVVEHLDVVEDGLADLGPGGSWPSCARAGRASLASRSGSGTPFIKVAGSDGVGDLMSPHDACREAAESSAPPSRCGATERESIGAQYSSARGFDV